MTPILYLCVSLVLTLSQCKIYSLYKSDTEIYKMNMIYFRECKT